MMTLNEMFAQDCGPVPIGGERLSQFLQTNNAVADKRDANMILYAIAMVRKFGMPEDLDEYFPSEA